jgi:hypothetical protein
LEVKPDRCQSGQEQADNGKPELLSRFHPGISSSVPEMFHGASTRDLFGRSLRDCQMRREG